MFVLFMMNYAIMISMCLKMAYNELIVIHFKPILDTFNIRVVNCATLILKWLELPCSEL